MKFPLTPILLFLCGSAFGRIGDNTSEIEARYGKAKQIIEEHGEYRDVGYSAEGFMIIVNVVGGISMREGFAMPDHSSLSEIAIKRILALSLEPGQSWFDAPPLPNGHRCWVARTAKHGRLRES